MSDTDIKDEEWVKPLVCPVNLDELEACEVCE